MIGALTRIVAVDDEKGHLEAIIEGLNSQGIACLGVKYPPPSALPKLPQMRLLFLDLHLEPAVAVGDLKPNLRIIQTLLEELSPAGPYVIVLWTHHPGALDDFNAFVRDADLAVRPIAVLCMDKADHIANDQLKDLGALQKKITGLFKTPPQLAALVDWESCVHEAAGNTLKELMSVIPGGPLDAIGTELDLLLSALAIETVGRLNVKADRFGAIREALAALLYDQVAHLGTTHVRKGIWDRALTKLDAEPALSKETEGRLNRMLHVAPPGAAKATDRGSVVYLAEAETADERFLQTWGISRDAFLKREMQLGSNPNARFLVLQVEATCDHAQAKKGLLPFVLGVEIPLKELKRQLSDAIWVSPPFFLSTAEANAEPRVWVLHFRFVAGLTEQRVTNWPVAHRLRNQLLDAACIALHAHGSRPGITSFRHSLSSSASPEQGQQPQPLPAATESQHGVGDAANAPSGSVLEVAKTVAAPVVVQVDAAGQDRPSEDVPATPIVVEAGKKSADQLPAASLTEGGPIPEQTE